MKGVGMGNCPCCGKPLLPNVEEDSIVIGICCQNNDCRAYFEVKDGELGERKGEWTIVNGRIKII